MFVDKLIILLTFKIKNFKHKRKIKNNVTQKSM